MASSIRDTPLGRFLQETKEDIICTWREDVAKINKRLDSLKPTARRLPIPSVVRGKHFVRESNISALMRAATEYHNALILAGNKKYIQFPAKASDEMLNLKQRMLL